MDVPAVREAAQTLRVIGEQRFDQGIRLFERQCGRGARFGRGNPGRGVSMAREAMDRAIAGATALGRQQAMTAVALSTTIELIASVHATGEQVTSADLARVSELLSEASAMARTAAKALGDGRSAG
jgi:hypothetical protein